MDEKTSTPQLIIRKCYWLLLVPITPDEVGFAIRLVIWRKGDDNPLTMRFCKTRKDAIELVDSIMNCE